MELFRLLGRIAIENTDANSKIDETTKKAESSGEKIGASFTRIGEKSIELGQKMAKLSLAAGGVLTGMVKYASDTEEATNKVDVAFGKSANEVKKFADTALSQFGIAKGSAMDMAALFGDMGTSMGLTTKEAAGMSTSLVGLAGDLASFKNIGLEQATTALNGIFTGETESLKTLGIVMTQTNLDAYALANGFGKTTSEMTQAELVALRYAYVMDATKNAQGDFARTGDSTANQLRKFKEGLKELAATFGEILLPIVADAVGKVNDLMQRFSQCGEGTKIFVVGLLSLVAVASPLLIVFGHIMTSIGGMISGFTSAVSTINAARVAVKNYQLATEGASLAAGVANGQLTRKQAIIGAVSNSLGSLSLANIKATATETAHTIAAKANTIATKLNGTAAMTSAKSVLKFAAAHRVAMVAALGLAAPIIALIAYMATTGASAEETAAKITQFANNIANAITGFANQLPSIINSLVPALTSMVEGVVAAIPALIPALINAGITLFMALVQSITQVIPPLVAALPQIINAIVAAIPVLVPALIDAAVVLFMAFVEAIPIVVGALIDAIPIIIQALYDGLAQGCAKVWEAIKAAATSAWQSIKDAISNKIEEAKTNVRTKLEAIKNFFNLSSLVSKVKSQFDNVKQKITQPIQTAVNTVKSLIDRMRSFFNFSWSLPRLKLPHLKVSGSFSLMPPRVPKFSISWYKKAMDNAMLLNKPTIFGASGDTLLGGGEAGQEVVSGSQTLMNMIREAVAMENAETTSAINRLVDILDNYMPAILSNMDKELVLDTGALVGGTMNEMYKQMGNITAKRSRRGLK